MSFNTDRSVEHDPIIPAGMDKVKLAYVTECAGEVFICTVPVGTNNDYGEQRPDAKDLEPILATMTEFLRSVGFKFTGQLTITDVDRYKAEYVCQVTRAQLN